MKKTLLFIISITATLLISGFTPQSIVLSTSALTIVLWGKALKNIGKPSFYAINNPQQHTPELIALALGSCLKEIGRDGTGLQLLISNPGINALTIHTTRENKLTVNDSHRTLTVENGDLWIADHPLPLQLKAGEHQQFNLTPVADGRIHVSTGERTLDGRLPLILISIAIIIYFLNFHCVAAALIAPAIHTLLARCTLNELR